MRVFVLAAAIVVCPAIGIGQQTTRPSAPETSAPASLPVRRVVLYKTGVGYFEHQGQVRNRQEIVIRFTSRQLNDVLKSLTTIDAKGQISNISYNSVAPIDQRLGALRLPLEADSSAADVLASLRGATLEVTSAGALVTGRLLGIERKSITRSGVQAEIRELSLLTEGGAVRSFELSPSVSVRVIERDMRQEIGRYLDVIGSTRERDVRNMVIATNGVGERPLFVSYVSEVPVWKSTYRLVIPTTGSAFLQGWAVVDNTIGEDWTNVELSLVAGAPQSFIQQISEPYYTRRTVVPMPSHVRSSPQTHDPAVVTAGIAGMPAPPPPPAAAGLMGGVVGAVGEGPGGFGGGGGAAFDQLRDLEPAAIASDLGDLFQYRIKEPVTLRKNQSALVPIVNAAIGSEKVSLWNRGAASGHPLRAVWLTNTTGLTLDGGSISIIDGNAFAGEGLVEPLAQSAKRLVSYADDLGIIVTGRLKNDLARATTLRAAKGVLVLETQERGTWSYAMKNEEASPATIVLEHRLRTGWELADQETPSEIAAGAARFRIPLGPNEEKTFVVREVRRNPMTFALTELDEQLVVSLSENGLSVPAVLAALKPLIDKRAQLAALEKTVQALTGEQTSIVNDQQRLRENMKALRGSAEEKALLQRYTRQLDEQETRLDALRVSVATAVKNRDATQAELSDLVGALSFEIKQ